MSLSQITTMWKFYGYGMIAFNTLYYGYYGYQLTKYVAKGVGGAVITVKDYVVPPTNQEQQNIVKEQKGTKPCAKKSKEEKLKDILYAMDYEMDGEVDAPPNPLNASASMDEVFEVEDEDDWYIIDINSDTQEE